MNSIATQPPTDTPNPKEILAAAAALTTERYEGLFQREPLEKPALAAIFEAAFTTPTRGLSYEDELRDLGDWIGSHAVSCDDPHLRMLALVFDFHCLYESTKGKQTLDRDAHLDLIRDVAKFFARVDAAVIAECDRMDAEEGADEREVAQ